jgi:FKBP-type peptidyl-prolyl cis-trans isomerase
MGRIIGICVVLFWVVFGGCSNKSKQFPGYSVSGTGIHYRLISLGDGASLASESDYITIDIAYRTVKDSMFFRGIRQFQVTKPHYEGAIDECFLMLAQGDSASFYIKAEPFFLKTLEASLPKFIKPNDFMRVDIKMLQIQTENQFELEKEAFLTWIEDFGEYEKVILKQYLKGQKIDIAPTPSGLYYLPVVKTQGDSVQQGDTLVVHYEGRFFNGKFFDSTRKRNEPFQFVYGQKWQVIEGLEEAFGMMREGEKTIVIVPSRLAFGEQGSSTGIVPAFTSVVFEVELLEVKKKLE